MQFRRYRLPLTVPVRTAHGPWTVRDGVLVRLVSEAGPAGYGEAAVLPWFGTETADEVEAACRELGAKVDDERLAGVPARLGCLRNALAAARRSETASAGQTPYVPVAALLPAGRAALDQIAVKAEAGFRTFKWKVGVGDAADELALLDDVCAELPAGAKLRLDANGAWDRRAAERWLARCAERPVEFVEQPCCTPPGGAAADPARWRKSADLLRGLAESFPTPIALDEAIAGDGDVTRWLAEGWRGIFVVKPALLGDADGTLAALAQAKADVVFSSALETAIGARAALQRALAWRAAVGAGRAIGFGVWPLFADARFDGPRAGPFLRADDVAAINAETIWTALN
jgi:O-succinylbenzoate synthase